MGRDTSLFSGLRRSGIALVVGAALVVTIGILIVTSRGAEESLLNNVLVVALINLNVMALLVLVFMVGRNVVKLVFERRRGILGSKLRSRLVVAFVLIACIPMSISFVVASGLINEAMDGWFSPQIDTAVTGAVTIARQHLTSTKLAVKGAAERVRLALTDGDSLKGGSESITKILESLRNQNDLYSVYIVASDGSVVAEAAHPTAGVDAFKEPPLALNAIRKVLTGEQVLQVEERGASQFIRSYRQLGPTVLVVSFRMDPEIVSAQGEVQDSFREYEELKLFRHPLKSNFILTLTLFNLVSLFAAIWVAFFVAKQITGPVQRIAEGTQNVARGEYDFRLQPGGDDEMGFLVQSFNSMLSDLQISRDEAEKGRVLIETILSNLAVGVIGLDPEKRVTTVNSAAGALLQIDHVNLPVASPLEVVVRPQDYHRVLPLISELEVAGQPGGALVAEVEMAIECGGRELQVVCTAGRIVSHDGDVLGYVLLFDDITEISRAQHLAAWRDVARRIAHEIKNPLTPLQLSAQRLERLMAGSDVADAVQESTRTIVEHVALIKRLANEFSEYGRMPTAKFSPSDLPTLLESSLQSFIEAHPEIEFAYSSEGKLPEMLLDPEQMRGVFINILENAVAAVGTQHEKGRVAVRVWYDRSKRRAVLEFSDNGPGIPAKDKNRVFEPYFTTKRGGTGLGLAIVSTIISDHQGEIRVFDNSPKGAKFVVTLPQHPHPSTLRRLGAVG